MTQSSGNLLTVNALHGLIWGRFPYQHMAQSHQLWWEGRLPSTVPGLLWVCPWPRALGRWVQGQPDTPMTWPRGHPTASPVCPSSVALVTVLKLPNLPAAGKSLKKHLELKGK